MAPDSKLVTQVLAGRKEAFGSLVARYQSLVYCVALAQVTAPSHLGQGV